MNDDDTWDDDTDPGELLARCASRLVDGVDAVFVSWIERLVDERLKVDLSADARSAALADAHEAAVAARDATMPTLRALLATDADRQSSSPLAILRKAVSYPTQVLIDAGTPPAIRDEFDQRMFPDDRFGLSPAGFGDIDPSLVELGMVWGAAKAHVVLTRRRDQPGDGGSSTRLLPQ